MMILGCKGETRHLTRTGFQQGLRCYLLRGTIPSLKSLPFPRHVKYKSLALPSHHTVYKQPLCTLGGASAQEKLKSPVAVVEIVPCAESHSRHAQDLIQWGKEV